MWHSPVLDLVGPPAAIDPAAIVPAVDPHHQTLETIMLRSEFVRIQQEADDWDAWYRSRGRRVDEQDPERMLRQAEESVQRMIKRRRSGPLVVSDSSEE